MYRFGVPAGGFAVVISLATLLIGVIVLRSPDTRSNLWKAVDPRYARTSLAFVGQETGAAQIALGRAHTQTENPSPIDLGRSIYLGLGCATCHGLEARGGVVGPSLAGTTPSILKGMVREGRGGMPVYSETQLTDADLGTLAAYLHGLQVARPDSEEIAALQRLTYDPSVPMDMLLKGKAAIRRSCGACHAQPGREDIVRAFSNEAEAARLVADKVYETNLSLEDAKLIAHYMLAVRIGADPVRVP